MGTGSLRDVRSSRPVPTDSRYSHIGTIPPYRLTDPFLPPPLLSTVPYHQEPYRPRPLVPIANEVFEDQMTEPESDASEDEPGPNYPTMLLSPPILPGPHMRHNSSNSTAQTAALPTEEHLNGMGPEKLPAILADSPFDHIKDEYRYELQSHVTVIRQ